MINKEMKEHKSNNEEKPERKPNELGGIYFSSGVKIFDPNSQEVLVHTRGDS